MRSGRYANPVRERPRRVRREIVPIEIPPAGAVGDVNKRAAVRRPLRLKDGFAGAAGNRARRTGGHASVVQLHQIKRGADPRHVRVVPREIHEPPAIGRQARRREEIVTGGEHAARIRRRTSNRFTPSPHARLNCVLERAKLNGRASIASRGRLRDIPKTAWVFLGPSVGRCHVPRPSTCGHLRQSAHAPLRANFQSAVLLIRRALGHKARDRRILV